MWKLVALALDWILRLLGVGRSDPVRDARRETEARARAEEKARMYEAALQAEERAREIERRASARSEDYLRSTSPKAPPAAPATSEEMRAMIDRINAARRREKIP